jgi:hypothetical protein
VDCGLRLGWVEVSSQVVWRLSVTPDRDGFLYEVEEMGHHGRCGKGAFRGRSGRLFDYLARHGGKGLVEEKVMFGVLSRFQDIFSDSKLYSQFLFALIAPIGPGLKHRRLVL